MILLQITVLFVALCLTHHVVQMYRTYFFYRNQPKMRSVGFPLPFIGHMPQVLMTRAKQDQMPMIKLANQLFGVNATENYMIIVSNTPWVYINDVKAVEELYTTYNHCFTKH